MANSPSTMTRTELLSELDQFAERFNMTKLSLQARTGATLQQLQALVTNIRNQIEEI